ncbi:MAG: type II secretion system protein [Gallionellaceae bacterium]
MRKSHQGFSLLEVLVAFVILALAMGVLMQIFSGGLQNATRAGEYQHAVLLAKSKLASIGMEIPLNESDSDGEFDSIYRWHVSIHPYHENPAQSNEQTGLPAALLPVKLLDVEVQILWGDTEQPHSIDLKTLRTVQGAVQ